MNPSICSDIKTSYGIVCHAVTPINGGWMNQLWRADTDHGELLIKQFSLKRYTKAKLADIESADGIKKGRHSMPAYLPMRPFSHPFSKRYHRLYGHGFSGRKK